MRKTYCDVCGKELRPGTFWGVVRFDQKDSAEDSTIDLCSDCFVSWTWINHLGKEEE